MILDSDGPVADADASARLRALALARVERYGRPVYFDLTADAITPVPDSAGESFRSAIFTFRPAMYAGVTLSFGEASEILRKNEAIRDAVIVRECAARPASDCGGAVHIAATTLVRDTESASARKLRNVAATVASLRASTLILVTAGWPYLDEQRAGLGGAVRDLRAAGARLVVLRVPARVEYHGLVHDASETVAARLSATFIALNGQPDVQRAHQALADAEQVVPAPSVDMPPASPAPPAPVRPADATPGPVSPSGPGPDLSDEVSGAQPRTWHSSNGPSPPPSGTSTTSRRTACHVGSARRGQRSPPSRAGGNSTRSCSLSGCRRPGAGSPSGTSWRSTASRDRPTIGGCRRCSVGRPCQSTS